MFVIFVDVEMDQIMWMKVIFSSDMNEMSLNVFKTNIL